MQQLRQLVVVQKQGNGHVTATSRTLLIVGASRKNANVLTVYTKLPSATNAFKYTMIITHIVESFNLGGK